VRLQECYLIVRVQECYLTVHALAQHSRKTSHRIGICSLHGQAASHRIASHRAYLFTYLSNHLPTHRYVPTYLPTYLHTYLPTYLPTYLLTHVSTYRPTYLPTYLPTYRPAHTRPNQWFWLGRAHLGRGHLPKSMVLARWCFFFFPLLLLLVLDLCRSHPKRPDARNYLGVLVHQLFFC
jgi:hypothetical protein